MTKYIKSFISLLPCALTADARPTRDINRHEEDGNEKK